MDRDTGLVVAFFDQARAVGGGLDRYFGVWPREPVKIATNPAMRAEFKRPLAGINGPELKDQVVQFVLDYADAIDEDVRGAERRVDLLDRAGMGIAASVTVAGIGTTTVALVTAKGALVGSVLGPAGMLVGGLVGLAAAGLGRHSLKKQADGSRYRGQKLRRLVENV